MRRKKVGPIMFKLAEMISIKLGVFLEAFDIWQQPPEFMKLKYDGARWGLDKEMYRDGKRIVYQIWSWSKMSDCVNNGFEICEDKESSIGFKKYEVYAYDYNKEKAEEILKKLRGQ